MTKEELNASCQFNIHNGIRIIEKSDGRCTVEVEITENAANPYGTVHGGLLFSACDTAACVAAYDGGPFPVTQTGTLSFVRPGRGGTIRAEGRRSYSGKHSCVSHVDVYDENRMLLATGEFVLVKNSHTHFIQGETGGQNCGEA